MLSTSPDPKVTSMTDRFKLSATIRFTDPEGTFLVDLRKFLDSYHGSVEANYLVPTSEDLLLLGLPERTITYLVRAGINTRTDLTSLTEEELTARPGIGWIFLRDVVVHLYRADLSLRDAPEPEDSLELLPLSSLAYVALRTSAQIVFRRVGDLIDVDILTMKSALGDHHTTAVLKALGHLHEDFDPQLWS